MKFIKGSDRNQTVLFPLTLEQSTGTEFKPAADLGIEVMVAIPGLALGLDYACPIALAYQGMG